MITPMKSSAERDSEGYELDANGERIYPSWAGYVPAGAKTTGGTRPPWVPSIANYWDESKPPRGWFKLGNGSWGNVGNEEHVKANPELNGLMIAFLKAEEETLQAAPPPSEPEAASEATVVPADKKPEAPRGIRCNVCERPFPNPASLRAHMNHHKGSDSHHADAAKAADAAQPEEVKK